MNVEETMYSLHFTYLISKPVTIERLYLIPTKRIFACVRDAKGSVKLTQDVETGLYKSSIAMQRRLPICWHRNILHISISGRRTNRKLD